MPAWDLRNSFQIASGCADQKVLVWNLEDYQSRMMSATIFSSRRELNQIGNTDNMRISYSNGLIGHKKQIEDLSFSPRDKDLLVSVGNDMKIILWDLRKQNYLTNEVTELEPAPTLIDYKYSLRSRQQKNNRLFSIFPDSRSVPLTPRDSRETPSFLRLLTCTPTTSTPSTGT